MKAPKNIKGVHIPKTHKDQADVAEKIQWLLDHGVDWSVINIWVNKFNKEYYANDHKDEKNGLFNSQEGYNTKYIDHATGHNGKPITTESYLNSLNNARANDVLNLNYTKNPKAVATREEFTKEYIDNINKKDNRSEEIDDLLATQSPAEVLAYFQKEAIEDILNDIDDLDLVISKLTRDIAILTQKGMEIYKKQLKEEKKNKGKK